MTIYGYTELERKEAAGICQQPLWYLAPRAGLEPATSRLTAGCSTN